MSSNELNPIDARSEEEAQIIPISRLGRLQRLVGSLYATAFLVACVSIVGFAWLGHKVLGEEFGALNRAILLEVHAYAGPALTDIALALSWSGSVMGVALIALVIGWRWVRSKRFVDLWTMTALLGGSALLTQVLKLAFQLPRPVVFEPLALESNFSFPSGHSMTSFCLWGYLGLLILARGPREPRRWLMLALCLGYAAMVALSRLYLGVHWPTDVVAGMVAGAFWLTVCMSGRRWILDRR